MKSLMKTVLLCLIFCSGYVNAQDKADKSDHIDLVYKSFDQFENDTIAFLEYNFMKRDSKAYQGEKFSELIEKIYLPANDIGISSFINFTGGGATMIGQIKVVVLDEDRVFTPDGKSKTIFIELRLDEDILLQDMPEYGKDYKERMYNFLKDKTVKYAFIDEMTMRSYKNLDEHRKKKNVKRELSKTDYINKKIKDELGSQEDR